jgi:hypothetical protein
MKKLKLKLDGVKDMLSKEQMRKISGGYGPIDQCISLTWYCHNEYYCSYLGSGYTCEELAQDSSECSGYPNAYIDQNPC